MEGGWCFSAKTLSAPFPSGGGDIRGASSSASSSAGQTPPPPPPPFPYFPLLPHYLRQTEMIPLSRSLGGVSGVGVARAD